MDGKTLAINDEHKLLLESGPEAVIPSTCPGPGVVKHPNFKKLFVYQGDLRNEVVLLITPREVDLELEERATDFYMEYWSLVLSRENQAAWQTEMCELAANRLNEEPVVIHGDHMLRMKGELIREFKCERIIVTAKGGFDAEEVADYERMLLGPTSEREVTYQFSSYYFQATGACSPLPGSLMTSNGAGCCKTKAWWCSPGGRT